MVQLSLSLLALCLGASATDSLQPGWTDGDTATGRTGPRLIEGCKWWVNNIGWNDSCDDIEAYFDITEKQFLGAFSKWDFGVYSV
jgi:hypothetical protein